MSRKISAGLAVLMLALVVLESWWAYGAAVSGDVGMFAFYQFFALFFVLSAALDARDAVWGDDE